MSSLVNSPLNLDTLFLIFECLSRPRDVSKMMKTCKIMHHAGARHLLRFGAILETEANIVSFSAFVLADLSIRASFVQTIAITLSLHWASSLCEDYVSVEREQMALESLAVVLRSADNLRTFRMDASQDLLGMSSALGLALRNCPSLR